jgi:PAS domain S-box-containing protein
VIADSFEPGLGMAQQRLDSLAQRVAGLPPGQQELVREILETASITVKELNVAAEELHQQNQELLAARHDLEAERRRYRDLFQFAPDGCLVTDPRGIIRDASQAAVELLNVPKVELVDQPLIVYLGAQDRERFHTYLDRLENGQSAVLSKSEWQVQIQPRNRPAFAAALTVVPLRDGEGKLTGHRWLLGDITATKRAEERERLLVQIQQDRTAIAALVRDLEREQRTLQTIMANTPAQLAYLDPDFRFVRVNDAYVQGSGHSREELLGRNHFELFPNAENEAIFEGVRDISQPVTYHARPFEYADQPERKVTYWDWSLVPVKDAGGTVQGLVLSLLDVTEAERTRQERKQLFNALATERARLAAIIAHAPEAIVVTDPSSCIVLSNPAAEQLFGRPLQEGESFGAGDGPSLFHPDGTPYAPDDLPLSRSALDGEAHAGLEMVLRRPDGERHNLLVSTAPILDGQGRVDGVVGILQDITERRRSREALRRYAERLRVLHDTDLAILAARSLDEIAEGALAHIQRLVACRRVSVALFDLEAGEAKLLAAYADGATRKGKGWHGPLRPTWDVEALGAGRVTVVEDTLALPAASEALDILRAEGVRAYISVPLVAQGQLIGALNLGLAEPGQPAAGDMEIVREMAAELAIGIQQMRLNEQVRRHAERLEQQVARRTAALQASQARLQAIYDGAAIGIALADTEGRILDTNPAFQAMLGHSNDELQGMVFADFTHPEDVATDLERFRELLAGERRDYRLEKRYVRKDGGVIWANLIVSCVRGNEDEPLYAIGLVEDITERRKMHDALLNAEKLAIAGRMGASLAHEINNPLQSVIGCLGLAEKNLAEGGDVGRYLGVARSELRRAARIVAQLRDMSRLSQADKKQTVDVNELVEEVLVLNRKQAQEHGVQIAWEPEDCLPAVTASPDRLRQVFLNLVLNAFDAMAQGGQLTVSMACTEHPAGVQVTFADTGVGMTSDTMSKLFDPFYTTKPGGLGLGLYITHNIVEEHGGKIDVTSRLGEGSTFRVWLPA